MEIDLTGRVLEYCVSFDTKISEVNLSAFNYRLFHEDFSSIVAAKKLLIVLYFLAVETRSFLCKLHCQHYDISSW